MEDDTYYFIVDCIVSSISSQCLVTLLPLLPLLPRPQQWCRAPPHTLLSSACYIGAGLTLILGMQGIKNSSDKMHFPGQ